MTVQSIEGEKEMITIKKNTPYYAICYNGKFNIYFVVKRKGYVAKSDNSDIGLAFDTKTRDITEISTGKLVPRSVVDSILGKERWSIKDIELLTEQFIHQYGDLIKKSRLGEYPRLVKQAEAKNMDIYGEYKNEEVSARIYREDIGEYISSYKTDNISDKDSETYSMYDKDAMIVTDPTFIVSRIAGIDIPYEDARYIVMSVK